MSDAIDPFDPGHAHRPICILVTAESETAAFETATSTLHAMVAQGCITHFHFKTPTEEEELKGGPENLPGVDRLTGSRGQMAVDAALATTIDNQVKAASELADYLCGHLAQEIPRTIADLRQNHSGLFMALSSLRSPAHRLYGSTGEPVTSRARLEQFTADREKAWVAVAQVHSEIPFTDPGPVASGRAAMGRSFVALVEALGNLYKYSEHQFSPEVLKAILANPGRCWRYEEFVRADAFTDALCTLVARLQRTPETLKESAEGPTAPPKPREHGVSIYG